MYSNSFFLVYSEIKSLPVCRLKNLMQSIDFSGQGCNSSLLSKFFTPNRLGSFHENLFEQFILPAVEYCAWAICLTPPVVVITITCWPVLMVCPPALLMTMVCLPAKPCTWTPPWTLKWEMHLMLVFAFLGTKHIHGKIKKKANYCLMNGEKKVI